MPVLRAIRIVQDLQCVRPFELDVNEVSQELCCHVNITP